MTKQEQWFSLIAEQEQGDVPITVFCSARGIKLATFHYWRKKYRLAGSTEKGFIDITPRVVADSGIRITYPNGVSLYLPAADCALIGRLIHLG
jgi:hypothetical protein